MTPRPGPIPAPVCAPASAQSLGLCLARGKPNFTGAFPHAAAFAAAQSRHSVGRGPDLIPSADALPAPLHPSANPSKHP